MVIIQIIHEPTMRNGIAILNFKLTLCWSKKYCYTRSLLVFKPFMFWIVVCKFQRLRGSLAKLDVSFWKRRIAFYPSLICHGRLSCNFFFLFHKFGSCPAFYVIILITNVINIRRIKRFCWCPLRFYLFKIKMD